MPAGLEERGAWEASEAANITNEIGLMVQKNSFFLDICTRTNGNGV